MGWFLRLGRILTAPAWARRDLNTEASLSGTRATTAAATSSTTYNTEKTDEENNYNSFRRASACLSTCHHMSELSRTNERGLLCVICSLSARALAHFNLIMCNNLYRHGHNERIRNCSSTVMSLHGPPSGRGQPSHQDLMQEIDDVRLLILFHVNVCQTKNKSCVVFQNAEEVACNFSKTLRCSSELLGHRYIRPGVGIASCTHTSAYGKPPGVGPTSHNLLGFCGGTIVYVILCTSLRRTSLVKARPPFYMYFYDLHRRITFLGKFEPGTGSYCHTSEERWVSKFRYGCTYLLVDASRRIQTRTWGGTAASIARTYHYAHSTLNIRFLNDLLTRETGVLAHLSPVSGRDQASVVTDTLHTHHDLLTGTGSCLGGRPYIERSHALLHADKPP